MSGTRGGLVRSLTGGVNGAFATVALICALLFGALTLIVGLSPGPLPFDRSVALAIQSLPSDSFSAFNSGVALLGGTTAVALGAAVIALAFFFRRAATPLVAFSALYSLVYNGVDFLLRRPRPVGLPHTVTSLGAYSFPSGHVAFLIWLVVLAMVLLAPSLPRRWFYLGWVAAVIVVLLGGASRIYVGAHWPSDVIGGLLVGVGWMALSLSLGRLTHPVFGKGTGPEVLLSVAASRREG